MPLPYSFLLGLFCLYGAPLMLPYLPHEVPFGAVAPYLPVVLAPWLVSRILSVRVPRPDSGGARLRIRGNQLLQMLVVPWAYLFLLVVGEYGDWVDEWAPASMTVEVFVKLLPLYAMEIGVHVARRQAARQLNSVGAVIGPAPFHLTFVAFLSSMILLFTLLSDAVALNREVHVFFVTTALGNLVWIVVLALLLCVALPSLFRVLLRARPDAPADSKAIATSLGFDPKKVQVLHTDERMVNAMLVGPVPGFRYLFLTDGLVQLLDPISLRGVVGHEVGHARANHPMWLILAFVGIPLLLFYPADVLGVFTMDETTLSVGLLVFVLLGVVVMKRIAHQFELEADLISADALGGSGPCILALHKVSDLSGIRPSKDSLRHPSEESRILHLLSCEGDPWFRERFEKRGKQTRKWIVRAAVIALALTVWAQWELQPVDRLLQDYYTGRFAQAQADLDTLPAKLPPGRDEFVAELREEIEVARQIYPEGGEWCAIQDDLGERALRRAYAELARNGPKTARPWFAVGLAKRGNSKLDLSLYLYCSAAAADDERRAQELRDHVLATFQVDEALRRALEM